MKNFHLIFLLLLSPVLFISQNKCISNRYTLENEANFEYEVNKNYKKALKNYLFVSRKFKIDYLDYSIAKLYLKTNQKRKAIKFLAKALSNGYNIEDFDKDIYSLLPKRDSILLSKKAPKLRGKFFSKIDYNLYQKIYYLYNPDQYLAKENIVGGRKAQYPIRKEIFKNNLTALRQYIEKENEGRLPQASQLGFSLMPVKIMLLHHTREDSLDNVNFNFFEKKLREELCSGNSYGPSNYAQFVDNMQLVVDKGEKQIYGYHINWKTKQIYPLKYPDKVDSLRASIGLINLKKYARIKNVKLPENYLNK